MKGVTDCRVSTGLISHPKKLKLQRRLGKQAVWSLIALWSFAASNRPDGSLAGMTAEDIAIAADWDGDADAFVDVLVDLRLIDGEPGQLSIHDWAENNPWAAGSSKRSESAKVAALIKHHGKDAARMLVASDAHAGRTAEEDENTARRMPVASEAYETSVNPQCPVSVSVSISASDSISHPPTSSEPSAVGESEGLSSANAIPPSQAERTLEDQQLLPSPPASGRAKPDATAKSKKAPPFNAASLPLPQWLPAAIWGRWVEARRKRGKPISEIAAKQQINDLWKWRKAGHDPVAIIETSIRNDWTGLIEPRQPSGAVPPVAASAQMAATADDEDAT